MGPLPFQLREAFHLLVLRGLAEALPFSSYAVKGGVSLRFFFLSPRLSEDLDMNIAGLPVAALRLKIRRILENRSLREVLERLGVAKVTFTEPKQTETTQRWKWAGRILWLFSHGGVMRVFFGESNVRAQQAKLDPHRL